MENRFELTSMDSLDELVTAGTYGNNVYTTSHDTEVHTIEAYFTGDALPEYYFFGKNYEEKSGNYPTKCLDVLQSLMLMCNATMYCQADGRIILRNKDIINTDVIDISPGDVISIVDRRIDQGSPDISILSVLSGDETSLASLVKQNLLSYHEGRWQIEATIKYLNTYNIGLFGKIKIGDNYYKVVEVFPVYNQNVYKIKAWRVE